MKELDDGTLVFPKRGNPPDVPEGYERTSDPFILQLKWVDCTLRTLALEMTPCKKKRYKPFCQLLKKVIDRKVCKNCLFRK